MAKKLKAKNAILVPSIFQGKSAVKYKALKMGYQKNVKMDPIFENLQLLFYEELANIIYRV